MPKMKTKSGAKKRFRFTATGKVKHGVVGKRHGMSKRGNRFLRQQTGMTLVSEPDTPHHQAQLLSVREVGHGTRQAGRHRTRPSQEGPRSSPRAIAAAPRLRSASRIEKVEKGLQYAYRDRRNKKRDFRGLWIQRINAGAREHGLTYSQFMNGILKAGIEVDRKVMADLAVREPAAFKALVEQAQAALK